MKKLISAALAGALFASAAVNVTAEKEERTNPSAWAEVSVKAAEELGLTDSMTPYLYQQPIERVEFNGLVAQYLILQGFQVSGDMILRLPNPDLVPISVLNLIAVGDQTEEVGGTMTREAAATALFQVINATQPNWKAQSEYTEYRDSTEISDWAFNAVFHMQEMGLMQGVGDGMFAPKADFSVEQTIATLVRMYDYFKQPQEPQAPGENAEGLTSEEIQALQEDVQEGHQPWRLDWKEVTKAFAAGKGDEGEGVILEIQEEAESCKVVYEVGTHRYEMYLVKPVKKDENGIWIVQSYQRLEVIGGADDETDLVVTE